MQVEGIREGVDGDGGLNNWTGVEGVQDMLVLQGNLRGLQWEGTEIVEKTKAEWNSWVDSSAASDS